MKTTWVLTILMLVFSATVCLAESSDALDFAGLAAKARERQASFEKQLADLNAQTCPAGVDANRFAADQASERSRLQELIGRNSRIIQGYESRLSARSSSSTGPAAPESTSSSSGGIMGSLSGLLGGGSSSSDGPTSVAFGADSSGGTGGIMDYLKENWPGLVGGMVGSTAGYFIGKRFGGTMGGIVGSLALGWLGQKAGEMAASWWKNRNGNAGEATTSTTTVASSDPIQTYSGATNTGSASTQTQTVPQTTNVSEAYQIMQERYQAFLQGSQSNNPSLTSSLFSQYMDAKRQFEALQAQGASAGR